ncbi:MAG: type II secretion system protein [Candidatus Gastranaerophilaceae bacterium]
MRRTGFTIIEVVVVFLLMLGVAFFVLPRSLNNTKQARLISKWTEKYSELEYMFSVIKAQSDSEIEKKFQTAQNDDDRKQIILETVKPYLRITSEPVQDYKQYYMNDVIVERSGRYHFDNFYLTSSNEIVGLKWLNKSCKNGGICGVMAFDVNGKDAPNIWGQDVFGINILREGIEPLGKGIAPDVLKNDCSKHGLGIYCSYYYLIGGKFD